MMHLSKSSIQLALSLFAMMLLAGFAAFLAVQLSGMTYGHVAPTVILIALMLAAVLTHRVFVRPGMQECRIDRVVPRGK